MSRSYHATFARSLAAVVVLLLAGLLVRRSFQSAPAQEKGPSVKAAAVSVAAGPMAGTSSCSAASCHGGVEARESPTCSHNEFSLWLLRDPHVNAFEVLKGSRSQRMGELLKIKPTEDPVCLACHTQPLAATLPPDEKTRHLVSGERLFGVGCEACHGGAGTWLAEHTLPSWRSLTPSEKANRGMVPVEDMTAQFSNCAGCHVGAGPRDGLPVRDVTHDLYAAGHPRLDFEPSTFLANLPPHWKVDRAIRNNRKEGQLWALGQIAAARQSLKLTQDRLERRHEAWPELAEFSCFACHHDLEGKSWRQTRDLDRKGRPGKPGDVPWNTWLFTGPLWLAQTEGLSVTELPASLPELNAKLTSPWRSQWSQIKDDVANVDAALSKLSERVQTNWALASSRQTILALGKLRFPWRDWDQAEQVYLGLRALNEDVGSPDLTTALKALDGTRAFPPHVDSPRRFHPDSFFSEVERVLKSLD